MSPPSTNQRASESEWRPTDPSNSRGNREQERKKKLVVLMKCYQILKVYFVSVVKSKLQLVTRSVGRRLVESYDSLFSSLGERRKVLRIGCESFWPSDQTCCSRTLNRTFHFWLAGKSVRLWMHVLCTDN